MTYQQGRADFRNGVAIDDSPYTDTARRVPWTKGWFDSRRDFNEELVALPRDRSIASGPLPRGSVGGNAPSGQGT